MSEPVLEVRGLQVRHGERRVLDVEFLSIARGESLVVMGPNGSGKSTLLRVLGLLEPPTAGEVMVLGIRPPYGAGRAMTLRRRMATVFQDPLLAGGSVADNVALGLRFRGRRGPDIAAAVGHWLERLGIAELANRQARTLSGGEAQRTSLARALVLDPEVLLLDEPFVALDVHGREALALELEPILRDSRLTSIFVTHNRSEALLLGDRAVVLMEGRIAQQGPVREVLARPATAGVARFLEFDNLLPVRISGQAGHSTIELAGARFEWNGLEPTGAYLLCVRADDVHLSRGEGAAAGELRLAARVSRIIPAGVPYRVHLDAGIPVVALASQRTIDRLGLAPGAAVSVVVKAQTSHLVPALKP